MESSKLLNFQFGFWLDENWCDIRTKKRSFFYDASKDTIYEIEIPSADILVEYKKHNIREEIYNENWEYVDILSKCNTTISIYHDFLEKDDPSKFVAVIRFYTTIIDPDKGSFTSQLSMTSVLKSSFNEIHVLGAWHSVKDKAIYVPYLDQDVFKIAEYDSGSHAFKDLAYMHSNITLLLPSKKYMKNRTLWWAKCFFSFQKYLNTTEINMKELEIINTVLELDYEKIICKRAEDHDDSKAIYKNGFYISEKEWKELYEQGNMYIVYDSSSATKHAFKYEEGNYDLINMLM